MGLLLFVQFSVWNAFILSSRQFALLLCNSIIIPFLNAVPPLIDIAHLTIKKAIYFFSFVSFVCFYAAI